MSLQVWLPLNGNFNNQGIHGNINFTTTGTISDVDGKIGKCKSFSSSNVIAPYTYTLGTSFSLCLWVNWTSFPSSSSNDWIFHLGKTSGYANAVVGLSCYHSTLLTVMAGGKNDSTYTHGLTTGTWHHIAFTWRSSGSSYLYVDGELVKTYTNLTGGTVTAADKLSLGSNVVNSSTKFNGKLNDVRFYTNFLSAEEVKEISKGLVLHYPLNRRGFGQPNLATCATQVQSITASSTNNYAYNWINSSTLEPNTTYTFSASAESDNLTKCTVYNYTSSGNSGSINHDFPVDGKRHSWTFTTTTTGLGVIAYAGNSGSTAGHSIQYKNIKIEKGNKATPYVPKTDEPLYTTLGLNNTDVYDASGYNYNGIMVNTFDYTSSVPKYQVSTKFAASNYIKKPDFLFKSNVWSVSFWYYFSTAPSAYQCFVCLAKGNGADANKKLAAMPNSNYIWFKFENQTLTVSSLKTNAWTHIVMTFDGTNGKVYENGVLKGTSSAATSIFTDCDDLGIGTRASAADFSSVTTLLNGDMSDVRIYATTLTVNDVLSLYNNGAYIDSAGNIHGQIR